MEGGIRRIKWKLSKITKYLWLSTCVLFSFVLFYFISFIWFFPLFFSSSSPPPFFFLSFSFWFIIFIHFASFFSFFFQFVFKILSFFSLVKLCGDWMRCGWRWNKLRKVNIQEKKNMRGKNFKICGKRQSIQIGWQFKFN
jgi:hypothetical protein